MALQRAVVDFGADESFGKAHKKLQEHYSIDVPISAIRNTTLYHAENLKAHKQKIQQCDKKQPILDYIIGQSDGTMAPIVVIDEESSDKRKGKKFIYREARVSLAYPKGSIDPFYEASFGSTDEVGNQMAYCVEAVGRKEHTQIHYVGDGATWIAEQVEKQFGSDASFIVDFYHMSQYLSDASQCCNPENRASWRKDMQFLLKEGKINAVLNELKMHLGKEFEAHECPAEKCYNYMIKRLNQLDYKGALEQGLPIGSGKIESAHRNIVHKRIKVPGAWWKESNAEAMLALTVVRENNFWDDYWAKHATKN